MKNILSRKQWVSSYFLLAVMLGLALYQFFQISNVQASVHFLNVGQGDAILIQTEEYKNILIDAGTDGKVVEELSKKLNFFNQKIDLFILTHPDLDHYAGILDVMDKYPIETVMLTGVSSKGGLYLAFLDKLKESGTTIIYPNQTQDWQLGANLYLDLLYPYKTQSLIGQEVKNKNDTSISLILRNSEREGLALLTGDAEKKQEIDLLLSSQDLEANVFKLGHHGSKSSSSAAILQAANAEMYVVSAGEDNKFGHPHQETLDRLGNKKILETKKGIITFPLN